MFSLSSSYVNYLDFHLASVSIKLIFQSLILILINLINIYFSDHVNPAGEVSAGVS